MAIQTMNHLYFLRHCDTEHNIKEIITGQLDIPIIKNVIDSSQLQNSDKLFIISSPLIRCQETMEVLKRNLKHNPPILLCDELLERKMGVFEGKERHKVVDRHPKFFMDSKFKYYMTPPEGESFSELCDRVEYVLEVVKNKLIENDVLICSHNQTMKVLYFMIKDIPIDESWYKLKFQTGKVYKLF